MDLVCISHLRWDFVFQRPQHLLTRAARERRVYYIEEPIRTETGDPHVVARTVSPTLTIAVPHIPADRCRSECVQLQADLLEQFLERQGVTDYTLWLYTPMALEFTLRLAPTTVVYDCMDELSAFAGAPPELVAFEQDLFSRADVVFTGGHTLYEAKRSKHPNVHSFPSSVEVEHFRRARQCASEPQDQQALPRPRIGFYGVIDERMDYDLLAGVASARPDWQLVLIGPTAKVNPADLPKAANIHYLGGRTYGELPDYIGGWDVAMLPFARNESTRFISPTKTPEYLAGGLPVVSTSIRDVVRPYGELGLAHIADTPADFVAAVERALACDRLAHCAAADEYLQHLSWDRTWTAMWDHVQRVGERRLTRV
ncbi:MAG: glycosyltransferase family 1 protein [Acidobacteria bacterium]|nr:glycosyltransferase family 1 protein [Acidobacteriota bacterium]